MANSSKPTKNQLRRAKRKAQRVVVRCSTADVETSTEFQQPSENTTSDSPTEDTAIEPQPLSNENESKDNPASNGVHAEPLIMDESNPLFDLYKDIIGKFDEVNKEDSSLKESEKPEVYFDDDDDIPDEEENQQDRISKRKRKEQNKLSVAQLKALVNKPELVEWTDTSAPDPKLLVHIKAYRNVVPVPSHWSLKREYLSSKRGIEKSPFSLPKFIQETGIAEMRDAVLEKQNEATLKQKQRERVQPKMGKLDIDYQKLYEAFFRFQTKPELTRYGEVYYEGKEFETNLKHLRPGDLSDELKEALNMPPSAPPPWLINQQRYGPPPSYPALKIPGLNAPPPPGASWGFHPGGYGKPPVDEATNRPLYGGDIFGVLQQQQNTQQGEPVEKDTWGELQELEESEEESEADEDEDEESDDGAPGQNVPGGLQTPGGMTSSVPIDMGGIESVSEIDLRKSRGTETEDPSHQRAAYQVIPEHQTRVQGFFGGDRAYDIKAAQNNLPVLGQEESRKRKKPGDVDVSMDPDALQSRDGIDKEDIKRYYEDQKRAEQNPGWSFEEDLSDMIASESRKRQKRDAENRNKK